MQNTAKKNAIEALIKDVGSRSHSNAMIIEFFVKEYGIATTYDVFISSMTRAVLNSLVPFKVTFWCSTPKNKERLRILLDNVFEDGIKGTCYYNIPAYTSISKYDLREVF